MKYMDGKELRTKILTFLEDTYQPSAMIPYGSFANGMGAVISLAFMHHPLNNGYHQLFAFLPQEE